MVAEHDAWAYFSARFGLEVIAFLEPIPGVPPTTYFDPRYARFVSEKTGVAVVAIAHQVDARPGTGDYLSMTDYNVRQLAAALDAGR